MSIVYLSLGSNQRNPERQLRRAIQCIKILPKTHVLDLSSFHWTKAWGLVVQQDFCNAVIKISTKLRPHQLLKYCQRMEFQLGRVRKRPWGPRVIDIDIILYGNLIINTAKLSIPHPLYKERDFVLLPLKEVLTVM